MTDEETLRQIQSILKTGGDSLQFCAPELWPEKVGKIMGDIQFVVDNWSANKGDRMNTYLQRIAHLIVALGLLIMLNTNHQIIAGEYPTASQYELYFAGACTALATIITLVRIIQWKDVE